MNRGSDPESTREWLSRHEMDRDIAAFENGQMVGTSGAYSSRITVPGGDSIPVAAVTDVAVLPTHNRRGIGTMLMRDQLERIRDRGEIGAALWASESIIYGRWGYGMAVQTGRSPDRHQAQPFRTPGEAPRQHEDGRNR